jgi:hypothetical protein
MLTRSNQPWIWEDEQEAAFGQLSTFDVTFMVMSSYW